MQSCKKLEVSIDFSSKFLINSLASRGSPPNPLQMLIFKVGKLLSRFSRKNSKKFEKIENWQNVY